MVNIRILWGKVYDKISNVCYVDVIVKLEFVKGVSGEMIFIDIDWNGEFILDLFDEKKFLEGDYILFVYYDDVIMEWDESIILVFMEVGKSFSNILMLSWD